MAKLNIKKMAKSQRIVFIVFFVINMLLVISNLYVLVFGIIQGLKSHTETVISPFSLPTTWHWENYIDAFSMLEVKNTNFLGMMINSLWYAVGGTILNMLGTFCVTYIITKYEFPGSKILNFLAIFVIMVPMYGSSGATYKLIYNLGLNDSPLFLLTKIGSVVGPYLIMKAYLEGISWTYAEAAFIDGASDFRVMWQVIFPQLISPFMAIFIMHCITGWNEFSNPLLYLKNTPVVSVGLHLFYNDMQYKVRMDILYAASIIAIIPIWIIYGAFNKTLLNLTFGGGIKG